MDLSLIDSTIVCLITPTETMKTRIAPSEVQSCLGGPVTIHNTLDGTLVFASVKQQLELLVRKGRLEVKDLSGRAVRNSKAPAAMIATLKLIDGRLATLGLNYEVEVRPSDLPSGTYIAELLLAYDRLRELGDAQALSVTLMLVKEGIPFTMTIEPRWGNRSEPPIFVNVNMQHSIEEPDAKALDSKELARRFRDGWAQTGYVLRQLLERVGDA